MFEFSDALRLIPEIELDLKGCGDIAPHGLPAPVVISLARRPDRWQSAVQNLGARGIGTFVKAEAIDGGTLVDDLLARLMAHPSDVDAPPCHYLQMTRPAVGCFLSHLAVWKTFLLSQEPFVLILEDDAVPAGSYTAEGGREMMATMPTDADMVLLGCSIMDGLAEATSSPAFTRVYYYNGTYGYILTRKGCLALMSRLLPIETHIDNQISLELVCHRDALRVYCTEPRWIEHDFGVRSDVYIPVADAGSADRKLDVIFKGSRARLLKQGARLFDLYKPLVTSGQAGRVGR